MSLRYWGENPIGTWTINVYFKSSYTCRYVSVRVKSFEFYGTNVIPEAVTSSASSSTNNYPPVSSSTDGKPTTTTTTAVTQNSTSSSTNNYPSISSSTDGKLATTTTTSYTPTATTFDSKNGDLLQNTHEFCATGGNWWSSLCSDFYYCCSLSPCMCYCKD